MRSFLRLVHVNDYILLTFIRAILRCQIVGVPQRILVHRLVHMLRSELIDEAKSIDYNKQKDEALPANGGIRSYFGHHSSFILVVRSSHSMIYTRLRSWLKKRHQEVSIGLLLMARMQILWLYQKSMHIKTSPSVC